MKTFLVCALAAWSPFFKGQDHKETKAKAIHAIAGASDENLSSFGFAGAQHRINESLTPLVVSFQMFARKEGGGIGIVFQSFAQQFLIHAKQYDLLMRHQREMSASEMELHWAFNTHQLLLTLWGAESFLLVDRALIDAINIKFPNDVEGYDHLLRCINRTKKLAEAS
jgi:hypothetical protein